MRTWLTYMLTLRTGLTHRNGLLAKDGKANGADTEDMAWLTNRTGIAAKRKGKEELTTRLGLMALGWQAGKGRQATDDSTFFTDIQG